MKPKVHIIMGLAILLVAILLSSSTYVMAQSNGLGIVPKLSYSLSKGTQHPDNLYVRNLSTSQPLNLKISVVDFRPQDESGTPKLYQTNYKPLTAWSLKPYLSVPDTVTVEPGKSKLIPFTIKLPSNIDAGSYYSAVKYTATVGSDQQKVSINASSATLVFVTVPGKSKEQLKVLQFGTYQGGKFKSKFTKEPPATLSYRLQNQGRVSENPRGTIVIKNIFGRVVAKIDNANPKQELALIDQTRRYEVCYPKSTKTADLTRKDNCQKLKIHPGLYSAQMELIYGQDSSQLSAKSSFWYMPAWFVLLIVGVVLLLGLGLVKLSKVVLSRRSRQKP